MKRFSIIATTAILTFTACEASSTDKPGEGSVALTGTATEQELCAALDGPVERLPALVAAVQNDAEAGISLSLDGSLLALHLSMTNNKDKVREDIDNMKSSCNEQAG